MTDSASTDTSPSSLPAGRWRVEPGQSKLGFKARGMWGLAGVKGSFGEFHGTLQSADDGSAHGSLEITASSLDTGNAKRDEHLRSADFFNAENHPTLTFSLSGVAGGQLRGVLSIGETELPLDAPLTVEVVSPDHLTLSTEVSVQREAAGLGWNKMGMLQGPAHLSAEVHLVPDQG